MKKIIPYFWFNQNGEEAVAFYTGIFKNSSTGRVQRFDKLGAEISGMPEGAVLSIDFQLCGQDFVALNNKDYFKFSPAVSMMVTSNSIDEVNQLWDKLSKGGTVMMELGEYPFSQRYGFLEDRFGVSWQIIFNGEEQKIIPSLLFVGKKFGRAEEAMNFYVSLFKDAKVVATERYGKGEQVKEGTLKFGMFTIGDQEFTLMDGPGEHGFDFTGAISLLIDCESQAEIDHFWSRFGEGGQEMPCGWIADKFGINWQVFANSLGQYLDGPDPVRSARAMQAMYGMKKIDMAEIKQAYEE